jgi:hypothetical protein
VRHFLLVASWLCAGCAAPDQLEFTTQRVDFGAALPGALRLSQVKLINKGKDRLHLAGTASTNPAFELVFPTTNFLSPNEAATLTVQHVPPLGATEDQSASLMVWTEEGAEATFEVNSSPTTPDCALPERLDFGTLRPGESKILELTIRNSTGLHATMEVDEVAGPPGIFVAEHGWRALAPGEEVKLPVAFVPGQLESDLSGVLALRPHQLCKTQLVSLFGFSANRLLSTQQRTLNFATAVGASDALQLTVQSNALTPVMIFDVQAREGTAPSQVFRALRVPVRIPPAERSFNGQLVPGTATIEVGFSPETIKTYLGGLSFNTDLPTQPFVEVQLVGTGR